MLMKNSQRQPIASAMWPPSVGPMVGASVTIMLTMTLAESRFSIGKTVMAMAKVAGIMAPAARPWSARLKIIV